jgi:hypothetical protein
MKSPVTGSAKGARSGALPRRQGDCPDHEKARRVIGRALRADFVCWLFMVHVRPAVRDRHWCSPSSGGRSQARDWWEHGRPDQIDN